VLLGVLVLLPGLGQIPLFDRDEPRFATAARTMMESGDFLVPRFNGALRPDKPPFVYWLMNIGYYLTGGWGELGARLPSAVCGIGTLLIVYFMVGSRFGRLTGMVASVMLGTCVLFMAESRMATADGTMLLCITACMACAWQAWDAGAAAPARKPMHLPRADYLLDRSGDRNPLMLDQMPASSPRPMPLWLALTFWVSLAAGTLTKGVPLLFVLVPMVILSIATGQLPTQLRQWRSHFHLTRARVGLALAIAAAVTLYLIVVTSAHVLPDSRLWTTVLGVILIGMILLPGLPGILVRCFAGGNWGWWRHLRPLIGVPLLVILVGWWVVAAGRATDWKLIKDMVGIHFLNRTAGPIMRFLGMEFSEPGAVGPVDPMKSYGKPPGFYLLTVWGTFWPWSILLIPAGYHAVRRALGKTALAIDPRPYQFLIAFVVPMWILLELARGKLLHYPLPTYVALAILCADALVQSWYRLTDVLAAKWFATLRWGTCMIWVSMGAGLLIAAKQSLDPVWVYRILPFGAALMAIGFASAWTWGKPSWPFVLALTWVGALLVMNTLVLPELPALQVSRLLGTRMQELKRADPTVQLAGRGYEEPALVFYAGSNVEMLPSVEDLLARAPFAKVTDPVPATASAPSASSPASPPARILAAINDATREELDRRGIRYYFAVPPVNGVNTGNFKPLQVALITNLPPAPTNVSGALPATTLPGLDHTNPLNLEDLRGQ
jgi:4-amino-4-deoxy-L-arabinose transferase-like glycosyltransferase